MKLGANLASTLTGQQSVKEFQKVLVQIVSVFTFLHDFICRSRDSVVGVVTRLKSGLSRIPILAGTRDFCPLQTSGHVRGPTQPSNQWSAGFSALCKLSGRMVKLIIFHIALRLIMVGAIPLCLYTS